MRKLDSVRFIESEDKQMKDKFMVYLAGPIAGCSYKGAVDWREEVQLKMPDGIVGISPMRAKDFLSDSECIHRFGYPSKAGATEQAIMMRDYNDVRRCDALFVNFLEAEQVSIGTVMELAWAYQLQKPVVVAIDEDPDNIHRHCMLNNAMRCQVRSIEEGIDMLSALLLPVPH